MFDAILERLKQASGRGAELFREDLEQHIECGVAQGHYESPIEAIFEGWWMALRARFVGDNVGLMSQFHVQAGGETYSIDFIVALDSHPGDYGSYVHNDYPRVAIELDGHDFHERTKEQVTYRNKRDRDLQGAGWKVLHVSGSELWRRPEECVLDVMILVAREFSGFWAEYWRLVNQRTAEREAVNKADAPTSS